MEINEFVAKKIGEVVAFAEVGAETFDKGRESFESVFGKGRVAEIIDSHRSRGGKLKDMVGGDARDIMLKKVEGTGEKLRHMRDYYVGDDWDNPAELLEWSGFFEGAAVVHVNLVIGAAEKIDNSELLSLVRERKDVHKKILDEILEGIKKIGFSKA